jgi:hypothetical protein
VSLRETEVNSTRVINTCGYYFFEVGRDQSI